MIIYVDDILSIHDLPRMELEKLGMYYRLKDDSIEEPVQYLGADVRKWKSQDENGNDVDCYALGCNTYLKRAIENVERMMDKNDLKYPSTRRHGSSTPFSSASYRPELDSTEFCDANHTSIFQNLIGILRWLCELGRLDVLHETALLSQYLVAPRLGHLDQALNIFKYMKNNLKKWLLFDPCMFEIIWTPQKDEPHPKERALTMKKLYPDVDIAMPDNAPKPLGNPVQLIAFVDADHVGNKVTRRSHTGIFVMANLAPIAWYSKKQNTVEKFDVLL